MVKAKSLNNRQSNIELLRLLSMLMIMVWHFNGHAICPNNSTIISNFFQSLTVPATTIFVLISGYFGIRFRVRSVFKLYLQCFIWGLVSYLLYCVCSHQPIGIALLGRLFAFTHNKWWFIDCYLYLMFAAPLLNIAIENMSKKTYQHVLALCTFVVLYFGYCRRTGDDTWGTCALHFMYIYMVGRYIHEHVSIEAIHQKRWLWLSVFGGCSMVTFGLSLLALYYDSLPCWLAAYPYNSPWTMLAAISLLLFALSFEFENKVVNWLASSSLSGYLFQDSIYFGFKVLYPTIAVWAVAQPQIVTYTLLIPFSALFLFFVICADKGWLVVFIRPSLYLYDSVVAKFNAKLLAKFTPPPYFEEVWTHEERRLEVMVVYRIVT